MTESAEVLIGLVGSWVLNANFVAAVAAKVLTFALVKSVVNAVIFSTALASPAATKAETDLISASRVVCPVAAMLRCEPALMASLLRFCKAVVTAVTEFDVLVIKAVRVLVVSTSILELAFFIELFKTAVSLF